MEDEIWKDIKGFEKRYQVSNMGRVKSLVDNHGKFREKILSPRKDRWGYLFMNLHANGKHKTYFVHRLVLMTFSPVENSHELQVNHINEKKDDNRLENLEWVTGKENCNHGTRNMRMAEKQSIPLVQLSREGKYIRSWKSSHEAEREGGYNPGSISLCCNNKYLREGNNIYRDYKWQYLHDYIHNIDPRIKKVILFGKEYDF